MRAPFYLPRSRKRAATTALRDWHFLICAGGELLSLIICARALPCTCQRVVSVLTNYLQRVRFYYNGDDMHW
jgi:hypothetical protein